MQYPRGFPRRGEIYMVDFAATRGSEQAGHRPALVVSNDVNNQHGGVVIVVPITSKIPPKRYPQNVELTEGTVLPRASTILCGQLRTIAKERLERHRGQIDENTQRQVDMALAVAVGLPRR